MARFRYIPLSERLKEQALQREQETAPPRTEMYEPKALVNPEFTLEPIEILAEPEELEKPLWDIKGEEEAVGILAPRQTRTPSRQQIGLPSQVPEEAVLGGVGTMARYPQVKAATPQVDTETRPSMPVVTEKEPLWYEKPKELTSTVLERVAAGISKVPVVKEVFEFISPALEFVHEEIEKPFAAAITAAASPSLPYKSGESWIEHEKREYEAWKAPTYVKGFAEFAMPLWWLPYASIVKFTTRPLIGAGKAAKLSNLRPTIAKEAVMPTVEEKLALIPNSLIKQSLRLTEKVPILGRVVKALGGDSVFTRPNPLDDIGKAKGYAYILAEEIVTSQGMANVLMNRLALIKRGRTEKDIFKLYDIEVRGGRELNAKIGAVKTSVDKPGLKVKNKAGVEEVSFYADDVFQNHHLYEWTDDVAKKYVETGHEITKWMREWVEAHGIKLPKRKGTDITGVGEVIREHIVRIAKGQVDADGVFKPLGETNPFKQMIYDTMFDGVRAGVKYGGTFAERVELLANVVGKKMATDRFTTAMKSLGKTATDRLSATDIGKRLNARIPLLQGDVKVLKAALASLEKNRSVDIRTMKLLKEQFPELAPSIELTTLVSTTKIIDYINTMAAKIVFTQHGKLTPSTKRLKGNVARQNLIKEIGSAAKKTAPIYPIAKSVREKIASKSARIPPGTGRTLQATELERYIEGLETAAISKAGFDDVLNIVSRYVKDNDTAIRIVTAGQKRVVRAERALHLKVIKEVRRQLETKKKELREQSLSRAKKLREAGQPKAGEGKFTLPALNKTIFNAEVVAKLEPKLADHGQRWIRKMAQASGASRMLVAAMDLSAPFIQGLMVFGRNPAVWAKGVYKMMNIAKTPWKLHSELQAREVSRMERVLAGGSTASIDYFEAMPVLRKVAGKIAGRRGERAVAETYGRAEAAFLGFGEIARDEMWKVGKYTIGLKGLPEAAQKEQLRDLAQSLDRMTGVMSPQKAGISITQQQVESAWIFFAPRYTRAGLAFMGDMIRAGATGAQARKALGGLLVGGLTVYTGMASVLGQEPNFDPTSSKFMTLKVGGSHMGVGGIYYATMRLIANMSVTAMEDPGRLSPLNLSRTDNPYYKYLYSRTAPLTGLITGLAIEQKDYFGAPFESAGDYAAFMADKVIPIAMQSAMPWDRKPWMDAAFEPAKLGAEFVGMRAFPESAWEARDTFRENLAIKDFNKHWDDLTRAEQREIEADQPVLEMFDKEILKWKIQKGKPLDILFTRWQDEIDNEKEGGNGKVIQAAEQFSLDQDGYAFRLRVKKFESDFAAVMRHIQKNDVYTPVMEVLNEPKTDEQFSELHKLDAAYSYWTSVRYSGVETEWGKMENELGEPEWANVEKFREDFKNRFGEQALQYVEDVRPLAGRNLPEIYMSLREARKTLRPYWKITDEVIKQRGEPQTEAQARLISRIVGILRKRMRQAYPNIDNSIKLFYTRP